MCIYNAIPTFIKNIYEFSIYTCSLHICIAPIQFFMAISFPSSSLVDSLFVSLVVCRYYIFIFNELALTNVIEHDDDDVDDERSEKKSPREEKNEASMQNSPHIDLTANRVLRVVPIDNHRQRYCLISYWSSSFD